ncbi:MAG: hypothetical protein AAF211_15210 [Myxococcota bacterium]
MRSIAAPVRTLPWLALPWFAAGCFEHFERLETHVDYDPQTQRFAVERRLVDIGPDMLGCDTVDSCARAMARALDPSETLPPDQMALSDRMMRRLRDSGALDVHIDFVPRGDDQLDAVVRYDAPVGSEAADDTQIHVEWWGKAGKGRYRLVVAAEEATAPPKRFRTQRRARQTGEALTWVEEWVLPARWRTVTLTTTVGEGGHIFEAIPGLRSAMIERGFLAEGDVPAG